MFDESGRKLADAIWNFDGLTGSSLVFIQHGSKSRATMLTMVTSEAAEESELSDATERPEAVNRSNSLGSCMPTMLLPLTRHQVLLSRHNWSRKSDSAMGGGRPTS
jgi:hypothetical protein